MPRVLTRDGVFSVPAEEQIAPKSGGFVFMGGGGWLGGRCGCGFVVTARSLEGVWSGMSEHQEPATCAFAAQRAQLEDEQHVDLVDD